MRYPFVSSVISRLLEEKLINREDSVLTVCAGASEKQLFAEFQFSHVVISNLDERQRPDQFHPFEWSYQDAHSLQYDDREFDWVFVSDGLHHCSMPHKALAEMYRVSKKGILVFESRDSMIMRFANKLKLSPEYELEAVIDHNFKYGGLNNSHVPNHIYRWTEREFEKTLKSFSPISHIESRYFYGLSLPYAAASFKKSNAKLLILKAIQPIVHFYTKLLPKQCNLFCMLAIKPDLSTDLWPWLEYEEGNLIFNQGYAKEHFVLNPHSKPDLKTPSSQCYTAA